jgi:NADPH2:quinone reductase
MTKAIRIHETGGPEVLRWEDYDPGRPAAGEALVRQEAVGLNFIDVYHRNGTYPFPSFPAILGMEGAGVVEAVGKGVTEVTVGERVAYAGLPPGAYAEIRLIPAHRLVKLPDEICQWASHFGATVIGTVGSEEKAELARGHGCHHTVLYNQEDFAERTREITDGKGVDAVYDSVGQATFMKSLDCLRPMGMMVSFGQSSGLVPPFDLGILGAKGSLFLTRPSLMTYTAQRKDLLEHAGDLFEVVKSGAVKIEIQQSYPLSEAGRAHQDLEARKTTGSTILLP